MTGDSLADDDATHDDDEPRADGQPHADGDATRDDRAPADDDHRNSRPMPDDTTPTERTTPDRTDDDSPSPSRHDGIGRLSTATLRRWLDRVGLAALSLLAVVAGWGFYSQSGNAIRTWFDPAYEPIALAVFNLAILFVALAGVTHQLRRLRAAEPDETGG